MARAARVAVRHEAVTIVGLDCATEATRTGVALGEWRAGTVRVRTAARGTDPLPATLAPYLAGGDPVLLALDAPLGWPAPLGDVLATHQAGGPLAAERDAMARRRTDDAIYERVGKRPLEVGADRIARTAHAALTLLQALREASGEPIPLAWGPELPGRVAAIEVYPAATLRARAVPVSAYRRPDAMTARRRLLAALTPPLVIETPIAPIAASADVLDAVLCVLAGADFLNGDAVGPEDATLARREGWIWAAAGVPRAAGPAGSTR